MARIAVAVSGGADSLYALVTLQDQGHDVFALHGLFLPQPHEEAIQGLQKLCEERHIPLHIEDFRQDFDTKVITPFVQAYAGGITPNPCALCNKYVKFGLLMDRALDLGAEIFATGHYASIDPQASLTQSPLHKGQDIRKDQSYFLALVPKERFAKVLFPLASTLKADNVRHLQEKNIAIPVAQESQEICFVPADAYRDFLLLASKERGIKLGGPGRVYVQEDGQLTLLPKKFGSPHQGLWQYTEGQRRGLGIAWKEPLYVCAKDSKRNALILGNKEQATLHSCTVVHTNFLVPPEHWPQEVLVRLRYRQQETAATVRVENDTMYIDFPSPQSPTAPGQIAAIYDAQGSILAGGIIEAVF